MSENPQRTWPEQNAIDEFFSHKNLMRLKEAVSKYRIMREKQLEIAVEALQHMDPEHPNGFEDWECPGVAKNTLKRIEEVGREL